MERNINDHCLSNERGIGFYVKMIEAGGGGGAPRLSFNDALPLRLWPLQFACHWHCPGAGPVSHFWDYEP